VRNGSWALLVLLAAAPAFGSVAEISSAAPTTLRDAGGVQVVVSGRNFHLPVGASFDFADGTSKEAFVISLTPTQIWLLSPAVNVRPDEKKEARLTLAFGSNRITVNAVFTFETPAPATPKILAISPRSGALTGGTRVTIDGEAFQLPVQVKFGDDEAMLVAMSDNRLVVIAPAGHAVGSVPVQVRNVNADRVSVADDRFDYRLPMSVGAVGPASGPMRGGTRISIDGSGFASPLLVNVAGVAAQVVSVTPTEIVAITGAAWSYDCSNRTGKVTIIDTDNGDSADNGAFTYIAEHPALADVPPVLRAGKIAQVTLANADASARIILGSTQVDIDSAHENANGTTTFTFKVPALITSPSCDPPAFKTTLRYVSLRSGCATSDAVDFQPAAQSQGCSDVRPRRRGVQ